MTDEEFRDVIAVFPEIPNAVAFVEMIFCQPPDDNAMSSWGLMQAANWSPEERIKKIIEITSNNLSSDTPSDLAARDLALAQMKHPQFARYIAGKCGCV